MWLPGDAWTRESYDGWEEQGRKSFGDRLREQVKRQLAEHEPAAIEEGLAGEIDEIVEQAKRELQQA